MAIDTNKGIPTNPVVMLGGVEHAVNLIDVVENGVATTVWTRMVVLFDTNDNGTETRRWYRETKANNGWGAAKCQTNGAAADWNQIDCTNYNYCTVRVKGRIESIPSGNTVNNTYIKIGFTEKYSDALEVVKRWANSSGGSGQSGVAYSDWYDLTLDVSALTGVQKLNVFIGGSYQNGGYLHCSKITMHN